MKWPHSILPADLAHGYGRESLRRDLTAGLTVALVALPQSMAYALVAGVEPRYGIYAFIVGAVVGAVFGSSRHLQTGPTNASSIVVASSLALYVNHENFLGLVFLIGLLAGLFQLAAGLLRMGNLTHYLSRSVLTGFIAAAGFLIAANQMPNLLGLASSGGDTVFAGISHVIANLNNTQPVVAAIGVGTIVLALTISHFSPKNAAGIPLLPSYLLAIIVAAAAVIFLDLEQYGIAVVGELPLSLPPVSLPVLDWEMVKALSPGAVAVALVGFAESTSAAKTVAASTGDRLDPDREFIGQGAAKIAAAFFSGIPVSGSPSRTVLCHRAGAVTRVGNASAGLLLALIVLFLGPIAYHVPIAALAGIVMLIAMGMIDWAYVKIAVRLTPGDAMAVLATFGAAIFIPLVYAIYIGVGLSLVLILRRIKRPRLIEMDVDGQRNFLELTGSRTRSVPGISIVHIQGDVFFGAVDFMEEELQRISQRSDLQVLILRMKRTAHLDATSLTTLKKFNGDLRRRGKLLLICGATTEILRLFRKSGLDAVIGHEHIFYASNVIFESTRKAREYALQYLLARQADHHDDAA